MLSTFKSRVYFVIIVEIIVAIAAGFIAGIPAAFVALGVIVINFICIHQVFRVQENDSKKRLFSITKILGNDAKDAFAFGQIGIVTYDEKGLVTWMSDLFNERKLVEVNKNIVHMIPELDPIVNGEARSGVVTIDENNYMVERKPDTNILFFKDITDYKTLEKAKEDHALVLGFIQIDNFEEAVQYADEHTVTNITSTIRQSILDWAKEYNMVLRRYRNDRYMMVMDEENYRKVVDDRFAILDTVRRESDKMEVTLTLSMSFARGSDDIMELDNMAFEALELAQSRGGDQVVYKKYGQDPVFFGGTTEAFEKRSRVRVRVMAQTIRDLIKEASNVIIVCHQNADFDCVGSALCMSEIVRSYHKECAVILKSGGIEDKLSRALEANQAILAERHIFVSEDEALETLDDSTLVICVDHHILNQSNGQQVVQAAKKVVVVDHHRRGMDLLPNTILLYIESSASSACELLTELMNYQQTYVDLCEFEATLMYTGIAVDTNRFRNHTGTRTFEAAANLKKLGADITKCEEMLKDSYDEFELKQSAMANLELLESGVVVSAMDEKRKVNRAILSQVADFILSVKDVEAAFVIGNTIDGRVSISARSNGNVNCQVLMETFHGGGHFAAAAAQIENTTVNEVKEKLEEVIHKYFSEEGISNESDFVE